MGESKAVVPINVDADIVTARQQGRDLASQIGFSPTDQVLIATAISEAARNILQYARSGEIIFSHVIKENGREGIQILACDKGPGIKDPSRVMEDGYSSSGGLGLGLPGMKRMMSEMSIESNSGRGTTVKMTKWKPQL